MIIRWPKDTQQALIDFYGEPKSVILEERLVDVVPPFQMYYAGQPIQRIKFHYKAAPALKRALDEIWQACGKNQSRVDALRISVYDGAYNPRKIDGSWRWSNHAFGAAIDFDAAHNGINTGHGSMSQIVIDAFKRQGARWGGDYKGRTDPMHFEFCGEGIFQSDGDAPVPVPPPPPLTPAMPVLQSGSRGDDVRRLQTLLLFVDGVFGSVTEAAVVSFQKQHGLDGDGIVGPETWRELLRDKPGIIASPLPDTTQQVGITATVFGGSGDPNTSAYTGKVLNDYDLYVALPYRFEGERPTVWVENAEDPGLWADNIPNEDVGPWNTNDPYWENGARPQAESGIDNSGRKTNLAGIDLSPALAKRTGISGKGKVNWGFGVRPTPTPAKPITTDAPAPESWLDFDIWAWVKSLFK